MPIDLVVFDMAGTTVFDGDAVHTCLAAAVSQAGVSTTRDQINAVMGMPKPLAIANLVSSYRRSAPGDDEIASIFADFERRMIEHYRFSPAVRECDHAAAVFRALHARGIRVALNTGFSRVVTNVILERLGWDAAVVDASVASDDVARGRPYPDMIWRAMELSGVYDVARVGKVGDTPSDLREGDAAGCALVVGVTSGSHTEEELARHPHTHLIDGLMALLPIVDRLADPPERAPGDAGVALLFTPGPLTTSHRVKAAMLEDVGSRDARFVTVVARVRERLLDVAGATREDGYTAVPMQGSGTFAVEAMLGCLVPRDGGLLVLENGAYGRRMIEIANLLGIRCVSLSSSPTTPISPSGVREAIAQYDAITHVAVVHCETTSGVINPLTDIAIVVNDAGRRLLVDAMSSFGALPVSVRDNSIEALAASSNKCLEGVPGVAFVITRVSALASARPRSLALDLAAQWRGFETDGQFRFTPPTHVILALDQALTELDQEGGIPGRGARYHANHERLIAGMRRLGFRELVDPAHQSDIITAFRYPDDPAFVFEHASRELRARNCVIYPGKLLGENCFRIGTIGRLFPEDMDLLVDAIDEVLRGVSPAARRPPSPEESRQS